MTIVIKPGETLFVEFQDTDGQFRVDFDSDEYPDRITVRETAGFEGSVTGKANELFYEEHFAEEDR